MEEVSPVLVHIPKTGGLTVRKTLGVEHSGHFTVRSPKFRQLLNSRKKPYVSAFLRDPVERALSIFSYFSQGAYLDQPNARMGGFRSQTSVFYALVNAAQWDAEDFWSHILEDPYWMRWLTHSFQYLKPQVRWVRGSPVEVHFYDYENFAEEIKRLAGDVGIDIPEEIPVTHRSEHGTVDAELSEETQEKIREWYRIDYELRLRHGMS